MNPSVGPIQYSRLVHAMQFYEQAGFRATDVPWAVSKEAMDITRPAWAGPVTMVYPAGGHLLCPVASAEQSFLELQLRAREAGTPITGSYVAMTPCFRNEPVLDALHQPYFLKVELISWDRTDRTALNAMLATASEFFEWYIEPDEVENNDPDPIGEIAIDIVAKNSGIELGSYGIRSHPSVGRWLYGTGLAEPRLSVAIDQESQLQEIKAPV